MLYFISSSLWKCEHTYEDANTSTVAERSIRKCSCSKLNYHWGWRSLSEPWKTLVGEKKNPGNTNHMVASFSRRSWQNKCCLATSLSAGPSNHSSIALSLNLMLSFWELISGCFFFLSVFLVMFEQGFCAWREHIPVEGVAVLHRPSFFFLHLSLLWLLLEYSDSEESRKKVASSSAATEGLESTSLGEENLLSVVLEPTTLSVL